MPPPSRQIISPDKLEEAILAKVLSKKFRKLKADDATLELCKKAIHYAVANKKPVKFNSLFGGNKLWRFDEAPEPDWAELFNFIYSARWMKSIAGVYEYGAEFEYHSQDVAVMRLNNLTRSETEQYSLVFRELLDWFQKFLPENVYITYKRQIDKYADMAEYDKEIDETKAATLAKNGGKFPELDEAQRAATELNVRLKPGQDDDPQWREKVEWEHQALFETPTLLPYLEDETMIPTCPTFYEGLVVTGSTKYSLAKFWAGVGALRPNGGDFEDLVLTPKQLEGADFDWEDVDLGIGGGEF